MFANRMLLFGRNGGIIKMIKSASNCLWEVDFVDKMVATINLIYFIIVKWILPLGRLTINLCNCQFPKIIKKNSFM